MKVELEPLDCKYYSTDLIVSDPSWKTEVHITVAGRPSGVPSYRELDRGWEPDEGMDHVEDLTVLQIAEIIKYALERVV